MVEALALGGHTAEAIARGSEGSSFSISRRRGAIYPLIVGEVPSTAPDASSACTAT
jgi:hypothetical protein